MKIRLGIYKHYKGNLYQVHGVARHSETSEGFVVYQHLDGNPGLWVRPIQMFTETVNHQGKELPRFEYLQGFSEDLPEFVDPSLRN